MNPDEATNPYPDVPTRSLEGIDDVPAKVLDFIPEESARHYQVVPLDIADGVLEVGAVDPHNIEARDALNFIASKASMPFKLFTISQEDFEKGIAFYRGLTGEVNKALSEFEVELSDDKKSKPENKDKEEEDLREDTESEEKESEEAPITKIVATILRYAADGNASDIHIEPGREQLKVRFRVDGILNTSIVLPIKVHSAVVARIKILSKMRLDEKRKPQDGRFSAQIEGRKIDFRVSTFPTYFGEKVVMRLLDSERGIKKLNTIGLSKKNLDLIMAGIDRPYGLILISGPTGSGKTTTLYSMINEIDREHENVLSLEDPIEYNIEGMNQSQVRPEIGYDFATALRETLRQDPDVIMVGEIRDKETAQLAIQAALTGHLVFSTIHTNSAIGVIPRLIDMGVDPYLIAPTLILAIAQRLVAALCPGAGKAVPISGSMKLMIEDQFADLPAQFRAEIPTGTSVYNVSPGPDCPNGTRGRVPVMEVLQMNKEIEDILLKSPTEPEIWKVARAKGMLTMKEDAIIKAMNREIPFEEVNTL